MRIYVALTTNAHPQIEVVSKFVKKIRPQQKLRSIKDELLRFYARMQKAKNPRCHLEFAHALKLCAHLKNTIIFPTTYACLTSQNTLEPRCKNQKLYLTAPSAVHLTICFQPDSQHRRLSVWAYIAVISASTV